MNSNCFIILILKNFIEHFYFYIINDFLFYFIKYEISVFNFDK